MVRPLLCRRDADLSAGSERDASFWRNRSIAARRMWPHYLIVDRRDRVGFHSFGAGQAAADRVRSDRRELDVAAARPQRHLAQLEGATGARLDHPADLEDRVNRGDSRADIGLLRFRHRILPSLRSRAICWLTGKSGCSMSTSSMTISAVGRQLRAVCWDFRSMTAAIVITSAT